MSDTYLENVKKSLERNLEWVLADTGKEGGMELLEQVSLLIMNLLVKVANGEPIRKTQKSRQG